MRNWQQRRAWNAEATVHEGIKQHTHHTKMEKQGFRMPAWQLTQQIQEQLGVDTMVGPTIFESDPSYQHTFYGEEVERINERIRPLLFLDAIPPSKQMEALERARHCEHWAVIGGGKQSSAVKDFLELYSNQQPLLAPD